MLERVIDFTSKRLGIPKSGISKDSKIESDFGIAGLDTITFYEDFFREFEIKNPQDFQLNKHVTSERLNIGLLIKSMFSKEAGRKLKTEDITVGHLAKVAEAKVWTEE